MRFSISMENKDNRMWRDLREITGWGVAKRASSQNKLEGGWQTSVDP